jgi:pimeloyl-ACP methyl ester carboxylesterase
MRHILALLSGLVSSYAWACDETPTGVDFHDEWLQFKMPRGLMPDPQFDGKPAKLELHRARPVYANGKCPSVPTRVAVLIHGRTVTGSAAFDLRDANGGGELSLQEALAWAGIESFAPSLLGYGHSTRFDEGLNDPCNASLPGVVNGVCPTPEVGCDFSPIPSTFPLNLQGTLLATNPLGQALCAHSSNSRFARMDVWVRDIRQVIDHAIESAQPSDGKVVLLGYSLGGPRVGRTLYLLGADASKQISRVVFLSSLFGLPLVAGTEETAPPGGFATYPLTVEPKIGPWPTARTPEQDAACSGRVVPGSIDQTWAQMMKEDSEGRSWGGDDPEHPAGLNRSPTFSNYGWNAQVAATVSVPVLVMHGADDPIVLPRTASCNIYSSLPATVPKLLVQIACASHSALVEGCSGARCAGGAAYGAGPDGTWGGPHRTVQTAVIEWIQRGTFAGSASGRFVVDESGAAQPGTLCP